MFPREITCSEDLSSIENCLETHLKILQNANEEQSVVTLLKDGTLKLVADTLKVIQVSSWQNRLDGIVVKISDIIFKSNEAGKNAKQIIISNLTENCLDLILSPCFIHIHKIELLKSFNATLENCPLDTRQRVLTNVVKDKLKTLCKSLSTFGDFELQVCIIEYLFRLIPKSVRAHYLREWIEDDMLADEFVKIRDRCFETDCRAFLNKLNLQNLSDCSRVYSVPAQLVKIDGEKIFKPSDNGYDDFWIDFNIGSKRIGIFCEPNFLSSQHSQEEMLWEIISIWSQDVKKYAVTVKNKISQITLELLPGAQMLVNRKELQSHLVVIVLSGECDIKKTLDATLKSQVKVSSVDPLCLNRTSDNQHISHEMKHLSNNQQISSQHKNNSVLTKSKMSVPSEPMRTPASSIVTSEFEEVFTWNEVQKKLKIGNKTDNTLEISNDGENFSQENVSNTIVTTESTQNVSQDQNEYKNVPNHSSLSEVSVIYEKAHHLVNSQLESGKVEDSLDSSLTNSKTQAKVRPSKKCTDMREHNLDARASDACVDVANLSPSVTEKGDNNSLVQHSQMDILHSSKSCSKTSEENPNKKGIKHRTVKEGKSKVKANIKEKVKTIPSTSLNNKKKVVSKKTEKQDPSVTPVKILRSGKKVKTPIQFVQDIIKMKMGTKSAKTDGDSDFPLNSHKKSTTDKSVIKPDQKLDQRRKDNFKKVPVFEKVKDPQISERATQKEKMKIKKVNGILSSKVVAHSTFTLAHSTKTGIKNISPGNISLDDFKPSKNFISLVKEKNKCEAINKPDSNTKNVNSKEVGKEKKKEAISKDAIPSFHKHSASTTALTSMPSVESKEKSKKKCESVMTTSSSDSTFLPELVVEIEASRQSEKDCEVIAETQIEQTSASVECTTIAYRSLNKQNQEVIDKQVNPSQMNTTAQLNNANNDKNISNFHHLPLNGSGDFHLTSECNASSNLESSYVFNTKNAKEKKYEDACKIIKSHVHLSPKIVSQKSLKVTKRRDKLFPHLEDMDSLSTNNKIIHKNKDDGKGFNFSNYELSPREEFSKKLNETKKNNTNDLPELTNTESSKPMRNLRSRNHAISYKESESPDVSLLTNENRKTLSNTQKAASGNNDVSFTWNKNVKATPDAKFSKFKDDDLIKRNGSLAPKKNVKNKTSLQGTWTRHEIKETFTMAYERSNYSSDPYDFDAECELEIKQKLSPKPCQINSFKMKNLALPLAFRTQSSNDQKTKSLATEGIQSQPAKAQAGQNNNKYFHDKKKVPKNNQGYNVIEKPLNNTEISEKKISENDESLTFDDDQESENSSCEGTSKFALYASQKTALESSSGLVFPHLDDSIPGTPDNEDKDDDCSSKTITSEIEKSMISEISWLEKAKKQTSPKLTENWKTYEKKSLAPTSACEVVCGSYGASKSAIKKTVADSGIEKNCDKIQLKHGINSSHETHKYAGVFKKVRRRKIRSKTKEKFPQKSHTEYLTNELADEEIGEMPSISSYCHSPRRPELYGESWSTLSSKIDHQLQGVIDRMTVSIDNVVSDVDLGESYISGPTSTRRPTKSELKRKYSSISSHSNDECIETDVEFDDGLSNSKFVPKRLFEDLPLKRKDCTSDNIKLFEKLPVKNKSFKDSKKQNKECISNNTEKLEGTMKNEKKRCREDYSIAPIVDAKKKKISSEVASTIIESKISSLFSKSQKSWDFTSVEGSPEKERAVSSNTNIQSHSKWNISPVKVVYSSSSPIPSTSNSGSLLKHDGKDLESSHSVNLYERFRKDILKSTVPTTSNNSSEISAEITDDDAGDINSGSCSLREFIASKQTKKLSPQTDSSLKDIMKSTSKVLQSSYELEQSRITEVKKFKDLIENVVCRMEKNLKKMNHSEATMTTLWIQNMEDLKKNRILQEKELKQLQSAHEAMKKNLGETFSSEQNMQKTFKAALKQDIDAIQKRNLAKLNTHSLDAIRRCFHTSSLMFT